MGQVNWFRFDIACIHSQKVDVVYEPMQARENQLNRLYQKHFAMSDMREGTVTHILMKIWSMGKMLNSNYLRRSYNSALKILKI